VTVASGSSPRYENPEKKDGDEGAQTFVGPANGNTYDAEKAGGHRPEEHGDIFVDAPSKSLRCGVCQWRWCRCDPLCPC
jgi:hypothetical protein